MISRQQFMAVQTWMDENETEEGGRRGINRNEKLKPFFFKLFSEKDRKLDNTKMVGSYTAYNRGSYGAEIDTYVAHSVEIQYCVKQSKPCALQLLYLSVDSSAELGLAKALSAVTGEHISLNQVYTERSGPVYAKFTIEFCEHTTTLIL